MDIEMAKDAIQDAIANRKEAGQPEDMGLIHAYKIISKPITEYPDVQRLITKHQELIWKYDALKQSHDRLVEALKDLVEVNRRDNLTDPDVISTDVWRETTWQNAKQALSEAENV